MNQLCARKKICPEKAMRPGTRAPAGWTLRLGTHNQAHG